MNSWPTLKQWCEFGGTLLLELLILFAVAKLISVRLHSAQWRRCIWQMVMVAMFLVVAGELNGVRGLIRLPHKAPVAAPTRAVVVTIKDADLPMETPPLLTFAPSPPITPEPVKSISRWQRHVTWPALAWCGVTALLLSRILVAQAMTIAFRLPWRRNGDSEMNNRVARIAELFHIRRRIVIANSARAIAPFTFGIWRPVIVLPINFEETFTPEQQDAALAHELAHVARFDSAWRAFSSFVCAVLWWNPFAWLAKRELDHASELVADESSLLLADGPNRLAECLVACAKQTRRPTAIAWLGMDGGGFRSALGKRVARLLQLNPQRSAIVRVPWYLRIVAPVICSLALWTAISVATKHSEKQPIAAWRSSIIGSALGALDEGTKIEPPPASTKDEGKRLMEVEQQWTEPVARTNGTHTSKARQEMYNKLRRIHLSEWGPIDNLLLSEVIRGLNDAVRTLDPEHKGVSFFISRDARAASLDAAGLPMETNDIHGATVRLGTRLRDLTVEQVLNILAMITDIKIKYSVEDYGIVISPRGPEREPLPTRFFKIDPVMFQQKMNSDPRRTVTNAPPRDGLTTNEAGGISTSGTVIPTVQNWFLSLGVDLSQQGKAVFFNDRLGVLMVRGTVQDLSLIEAALQQPGLQSIRPLFEKAPTETAPGSPTVKETNAPASANPQTNAPVLHTRFFKVDPNTFQQSLQNMMAYDLKSGRARHLPEFDGGTNGVIPALQALFKAAGADLTADGKAIFFSDTRGMVMVRATLQELDTIEKAMQMLIMSPPQLTIDVKAMEVAAEAANQTFRQFGITNAQAAPVSSPTGVSNRPLPTLSGILTEPQFRSVIRAMEKIGGTDLLNMPTVTTMSGRQAQIKVVDIRYLVTGLNTNTGLISTNKDVRLTVTPNGTETVARSVPTNNSPIATEDGRYIAERFEISPVVDLVPYVLADGYTIQMTVLPTLREFLGYDDGPRAIWATGGPFATPDRTLQEPIPLPKFRLRQVATSARVWDGQTLVLGAGNSRTMEQDRDANGIITTNYTEKALFFFVTPRLIDPAGNPLHSGEELHEVHKTVPEQKQIPQR